MPERPLLLFDSPRTNPRTPGTPRPIPRPQVPNRTRQAQRVGPAFQRLRSVVDNPDNQLELRSQPDAILPDRALVFEVAGNLGDFSAQARRVGFELLAEIETEFDPDEDFYNANNRDQQIKATLYLVMPDLRAMTELLSLWEKYERGEQLPRGYGKWRELFNQLKRIRSWGKEDKYTPSFKDELDFWLSINTTGNFKFELNLWFTDSSEQQSVAYTAVTRGINNLGGTILDHTVITPIRYHAVLVSIPYEAAQNLQHGEHELLNLDDIMFFAPQAMAAFPFCEATSDIAIDNNPCTEAPIAALLDGYPLANHNALEGRIDIDDFLEIEPQCQTANRHHGTAMASLITHGDLSVQGEENINRRLLVLPVMVPNENGEEALPEDKLPLDIIYQAVLRLKRGTQDMRPSGEQIVVINHSLADSRSPYTNQISPWGRLIDYLSFTFNVLFVVSAGNYKHQLTVPNYSSIDFEQLDAEEMRNVYLESLAKDIPNRQLLAPAEALNSITVGAWHADNNENEIPAQFFNVLPEGGPSIISAVGLGHKRSIKPDIYFDGGKTLARLFPATDGCMLRPVATSPYSGQTVAAPNATGDLTKSTTLCGTSNATALVTRKAIQLHEAIEGVDVPQTHQAVLLKALLLHGSAWNENGTIYEEIIEPLDSRKHQARRTNISRLLGIGRPDINRVLECTKQRATILQWGTISKDESQTFSLPLPTSLSRQREFRKLTVTLAWFSPINPRHQQYRQAVLDLNIPDATNCGTKRNKVLQPPQNTLNRGTVVHHIFEGKQGVTLSENAKITVSCRQQAGTLDDPVNFAIVASFEVGVDSEIDVYEEIRAKLQIPQRIQIQ